MTRIPPTFASPKVTVFPRAAGPFRKSDLRVMQRETLPANVECLSEHGHKRPAIGVSRSPELLLILAILKAMSGDARRDVRQQIAEVCNAFPADENARAAMSLAAKIF